MTRRGADEPQVYRITRARPPHSDDLDRRINRYLISMAIRTACVILVFVVHGPARWVFCVGAVFLPYVAVLFANASGRQRVTPDASAVDHRGLGSGESSGAGPGYRIRPTAENDPPPPNTSAVEDTPPSPGSQDVAEAPSGSVGAGASGGSNGSARSDRPDGAGGSGAQEPGPQGRPGGGGSASTGDDPVVLTGVVMDGPRVAAPRDR